MDYLRDEINRLNEIIDKAYDDKVALVNAYAVGVAQEYEFSIRTGHGSAYIIWNVEFFTIDYDSSSQPCITIFAVDMDKALSELMEMYNPDLTYEQMYSNKALDELADRLYIHKFSWSTFRIKCIPLIQLVYIAYSDWDGDVNIISNIEGYEYE